MSASYRQITQTDVHNLFFAGLREIAKKEGPEAEEVLSCCEITVDMSSSDASFFIRLEVLKTVVREWKINLDAYDMSESVKNILPLPMQSNLSLLGQIHFVRLHKYFPKAIKDVAVEFCPERNEKFVKVYFKNGHVVEGSEQESKSDLFIAKCSMLFDLPPL